jgi:hypothetical protein
MSGETPSGSGSGSAPGGGNEGSSSPSAVPGAVVACPAEDVVYAPQYRGGYDSHTRIMALLAVITPLLTTIVAFYFGQRSGAAEGEAKMQRVVSHVMGTNADNPESITDLKNLLKAEMQIRDK